MARVDVSAVAVLPAHGQGPSRPPGPDVAAGPGLALAQAAVMAAAAWAPTLGGGV